MPPSERQEVRRREQIGARRQGCRPRQAVRARPRTPTRSGQQDRRPARDPEHAAPAEIGRQRSSPARGRWSRPAPCRRCRCRARGRASRAARPRTAACWRWGRRRPRRRRPARGRTAASGTSRQRRADGGDRPDEDAGEDHLARADAVGDRARDQRGEREHEQVDRRQPARARSWTGGTTRRCAASSRRRPAGPGS